jgi:pyruvate,water dikinase
MMISPLRSSGAATLVRYGGKGHSLSQLIDWGLPVPDGFVVTTEAYAHHAAQCGLLRELAPLLEGADQAGAAALARRLLTGTAVDPAFVAQLGAAWRELGAPAVAVRSSATAEDLADASFAGQHDSFLGVAEEGALLDAVRNCWASLWSERALRYRAERRIAPAAVAMAVVVQRLVPAEAAGVLFTVDPLTQRRDRMLVEIVPGLGEALVSGRTRGESCLLERRAGRLRLAGAAPRFVTRAQLLELGERALQIEARAGVPQDIEFAVAAGRVAILQARPITTLGEPVPALPPPSYMDRKMQTLALERYAVAPRPLDNVVFVRMVGAAAFTAQQFGLVIEPRDLAAFRQTLWHQQYRFPRNRPTLRLLTHPWRSFGLLRTDWLAWWQGEPRQTLRSISAIGDPGALPDAGLLTRAGEILQVWEGITNRRFHAVSSIYAEPYLQALVALAVGPAAAAKLSGQLLAGITTPANDANDALWELSRLARQDPAVSAAIAREPWGAIPPESPFAVAYRGFLARFGHCESGGFYLSLPTWRHDPAPVRQILRALVGTDERPRGSGDTAVRARELVERRLRWFPWLRRHFRTRLEQVRALHRMREESHHDLTRPLDALQSIVAECARRLRARGLIAAEDDVFYLTFAELGQWLLAPPAAGTAARDFIARRRATYRLVNARWQRHRPPPRTAGPKLSGVSGSPGRVRGPARVVLDETQFDRLRRGDILVCPHSNPSWTPLFLTAAGVVSDTGGAASHAAIVAREYGLPAVLAVPGATTRIRDGDTLELDGDRGTVTVVAPASR